MVTIPKTGNSGDKTSFLSRAVAVVRDLSPDEQLYLYGKTRELKDALTRGGDLSPFKIEDPSMAFYVIFLESSTRTKESFINAAQFHSTKLNIFDAAGSSFTKMESYQDTFNMLCGYSRYSIFITRTKLEGVCRWLERAVGSFAERNGIMKPAFINGGDGKHEHPTQEFLDEFTFLEHKGWDNSHIHIALIGDLFHGRTVHSKVEGLTIFKEVQVDLVAPEELAMPAFYVEEMKRNGFEVKTFSSIREYLESRNVAPIWYFTRPQLERMGEKILQKAHILRKAVTFERKFLDRYSLPDNTRFYHPLPRHKEYPEIPFFLDRTPLNGWEKQSINGYYIRTMLLALLGGKAGHDFRGKEAGAGQPVNDFIEELTPEVREKPEYKVGIRPITEGIVIDHIEKGEDEETVWDHIDRIRKVINLNMVSSHGVFKSEKDGKCKGMLSLPDMASFDEKAMEKLAAVSPDCTLNVIKEHKVFKKFRLHMPGLISGFGGVSCKNGDCISHPAHNEHVAPEFSRTKEHLFRCVYCSRPHHFKEIWDI
jgi:aspartate carbamoyltransferase